MTGFGKSLPGKMAYRWFSFKAECVAGEVNTLVEDVRRNGVISLRGEFRDLNEAGVK